MDADKGTIHAILATMILVYFLLSRLEMDFQPTDKFTKLLRTRSRKQTMQDQAISSDDVHGWAIR